MPYYTYIICNYWAINKILFEYYLGFDFYYYICPK